MVEDGDFMFRNFKKLSEGRLVIRLISDLVDIAYPFDGPAVESCDYRASATDEPKT